MLFRSATADPTDLDRAAAYPADGPVEALPADRIREELAANQFRPEWIWFAEDEDGEILARALWWGRADSERPIALDCLQVRSTVADPAAVAAGLLAAGHAAFGNLPAYNISLPSDWRARPDLAAAVAWRQEAAYKTGLTSEIERLRYEWTPAAGTAGPTGRLVFREGTDEEFLDAFTRLSADSLDLHTQNELRSMDAGQLAREDIEFYLDCPGERSWWRLAELPDGTLAGMAIPSATPYHRNVGYLGVVPEQRGQGLIDEILAEITRFHAGEGADRITATTDTANAPMAAAFDRAGYEVTEIRLVLEQPPHA
ncbi:MULTISPECIES: GNAT family N-acetyltransferase [unclassified Streptomyces]|uniref:GNAT family N-acetyltransferase n=1 Tax=unclassified Streptomyces TaxID=2593676 RepID=UPI001BE8F89E|nr:MULTISPECIES: GNAT family N-acetyltransferase [unclassified Streptomyces]MBT2404051.1 GNAT family N-acetyltransferase [Streptomyces sp. ISL-21]MBT2607904.1 GNAT family N-acetyltransferase [Streptomyces sp. ISL-87]